MEQKSPRKNLKMMKKLMKKRKLRGKRSKGTA
jgi:hypothetical protein